VFIVDDHAVVRNALRFFLLAFDDLALVGMAANGTQALRLCEEIQPDVVLMDLVMPGMDGVSATRAIRQRHKSTQIIALTSFGEEELVRGALEAGAVGYLLKDVSPDDLVAAIRTAHADRPMLESEANQL
jgi:NarL family two-component system response regulator LiaR